MFTGIVTDIGTILAASGTNDVRFDIETRYDLSTVALGASIACNGVCLTVVGKEKNYFSVDVSGETLSRTTLGSWKTGTEINLERALALGDELGGHMVSGHVDAVATVLAIAEVGGAHRLTVEVPEAFSKYIAEKGSITLDGVSLTVNGVEENSFWVTLIPHTWTHTTFKHLKLGARINLEIDMLARYVERMLYKGSVK